MDLDTFFTKVIIMFYISSACGALNSRLFNKMYMFFKIWGTINGNQLVRK